MEDETLQEDVILDTSLQFDLEYHKRVTVQ